MEIELDTKQQQLYSRLFVSDMDLSSAAFSLEMLLKKGWHARPWERRGSIYEQQTAYTTAFVIAYARPFNKSYGWPAFPSELIHFDSQEQELHDRIITLRNKAVAHSDSELYSIRRWRSDDFSTDIVGAPQFVISGAEGTQMKYMTWKLKAAIAAKLKELVP